MHKKLFSFILRSRLEDVTAVTISLSLVILFLTTRLFHSFSLGMHDFIFLLLPLGVLGVKTLLGLLASSTDQATEEGPLSFLTTSFRPFLLLVRDWFPFILLSACYFSLYSNLVLRVNPRTADAVLSRIDGVILGHQPSLLLEPMIHPWLTDFLNAVYFSFVLYLPGIALAFYVRKDRPAFRRLMMGYLTLVLMGVTSYILVPATGPEKFLATQYQHDLEGRMVSHGIDFIMQNARVAHDCFPSLHVAIPLLLALYIRDYWRKGFVPALAYVAVMCFATIYLRYHYMIDVLAAFIYAPAAYSLNDFVLARWPGERIVRASRQNLAAGPREAQTSGPIPEPVSEGVGGK